MVDERMKELQICQGTNTKRKSFEVICKIAIYFGLPANDLKYVIVIFIEGTTRN